jgi:hypothetical protein
MEIRQQYTDVVTHAVVTGKTIKGIAKSVGKSIVGTVQTGILINERHR